MGTDYEAVAEVRDSVIRASGDLESTLRDITPGRRERIATACLAGMLANPESEVSSRRAVRWADDLIAVLDRVPAEAP